MPQFSKLSLEQLVTCDERLQRLFMAVVRHYDCVIVYGHRGEAEQNDAFEKGLSRLVWPDSFHNKLPSLAVDAAPYPINWKDTERFYAFGGFVLGVASQMGLKIRWGADWDRDTEVKDQTFNDLMHFEVLD